MTGACCFFKFFRRSAKGKYLMRFSSETSVFKFLRRIVNRGLKTRASFSNNQKLN